MSVKFTWKWALFLLLLLPVPSFSIGAASGYCEVGNQSVVAGGLTSTTKVQKSYPQCTVTVYVSNVTPAVLATLYSDNAASPTPLTNPFTATTSGSWAFFAGNGQYDVVLSGGGLASPVTIYGRSVFDPSAATGLVFDCTTPRYTGANAGARIKSCIDSLPSTGGVADATGFKGSQTATADMFSGVGAGKCGALLLGSISLSFNATQNMPTCWQTIGIGRGATTLVYTGSGTAISFGSGVAKADLRDLTLQTSQAGSTIGMLMTSATETSVENVRVAGGSSTTGFGTAIKITGNGANVSSFTRLTNVDVYDYVTTGVSIDQAIETYMNTMFIESAANGTTATAVVLNTGASGVYMQVVSTLYGLHGLWIKDSIGTPSTTSAPRFIWADSFLADTTSGGHGILFDSSLSTSNVSSIFVNSWAAASGRSNTNTQVTAGANGIQFDGGQNVVFSGCRVRAVDNSAVVIASANVSNITIDRCLFTENNQGAAAGGQGVDITAAATDIVVSGNVFSNRWSSALPSGNTRYGVRVAAVNADLLKITNNNMNYVATGDISNADTGRYNICGNSPNYECTTYGLSIVNIGFNTTGENDVFKQFRTGGAAGNVPSEFKFGMNDGAFAGLRVVDVRNGGNTANDQSLEFHTQEGGVTSGARMTIQKNGQVLLAPITFANLGTPANGTINYCSNCTVANPCAGAGTGALAKRLNGAWVCN